MDLDPTDTAQRARALFADTPGRSALQDWMRENHALVTYQLAASRPRWIDIAKTIAAQGVRDANGQIPRPETVRRAWQRATDGRASKRRSAARSASGFAASALPEASAAPAASGSPPAQLGQLRASEDLTDGINVPSRPRFGVARPR